MAYLAGQRRMRVVAALAATLLLLGCAEKAKTVQIGAAQFKAESFAAIDRIGALQAAEITAPPLPPGQAADKFVALVEGSTRPIDQQTLQLLLNPGAIDTPASSARWQKFLDGLRAQYAAFASVFESLDQGSLLAAPDVRRAIAPLDRLTAQMAAFAKTIQAHPAMFIAERANLAADIESARDNSQLSPAQKRAALLQLRERLVTLAAAEQRMTTETAAQCLKAASLGLELRKLLAAYDTLTIDDLMGGLATAFQVAGTVAGRDFGGLQTRTESVIAEFTATPELKALFDEALQRAGEGVSRAATGS